MTWLSTSIAGPDTRTTLLNGDLLSLGVSETERNGSRVHQCANQPVSYIFSAVSSGLCTITSAKEIKIQYLKYLE